MIKLKIENIIIYSFIGLIIAIFVGFGGNIILKAGLPAKVTNTDIDFESRLISLDKKLASGDITRAKYDSLAGILRLQMKRSEAVLDEIHNPDKMPEWVSSLGITEPEGMKFDKVFSNYTSADDHSEGFNSVSLVYTGTYVLALNEAKRIASKAKLSAGGNFKASGGPGNSEIVQENSSVSYMNYSLGDTDKDFLISLQVMPSGRLTIMVTDNKQLNERLSVYEPLNVRQYSAAKQKKQ
jgi:hypothetical protein